MDYKNLGKVARDIGEDAYGNIRDLFGNSGYEFACARIPSNSYNNVRGSIFGEKGLERLIPQIFSMSKSRSRTNKGHTQIHGTSKTVSVHINGRGNIQVSRKDIKRSGMGMKQFLMGLGASAKEASSAIKNCGK